MKTVWLSLLRSRHLSGVYDQVNTVAACNMLSFYRMPCTALHLLPDDMIVAGYMNGKIRIFDTAISVLLAEISAHARVVSSLDALSLRDDHYTVRWFLRWITKTEGLFSTFLTPQNDSY